VRTREIMNWGVSWWEGVVGDQGEGKRPRELAAPQKIRHERGTSVVIGLRMSVEMQLMHNRSRGKQVLGQTGQA
jgi:hypothetical protein